MYKINGVVAAALVFGAGALFAAELKVTKAPEPRADPWDVAFGGALMNDYNFRGITLSARRPSTTAYIEPRYKFNPNLEMYVGLSAATIDSPNRAAGQIAYYGGLRPTFGALSLDLGLEYIDYPGGRTYDGLGSAVTCTNGAFFFGQCNTIKADESYWEFYFKPSFTVSKAVQISGSLNYSPSWANTGAAGTYVSFITAITLPAVLLPSNVHASVSGEIGHYWYGTTDAFYGVPAFPSGIKLPDYTTWNVGLTFTYKVVALDLRYYDTNLSKANCNVLTSDHTATFGGASAVTPTNPSGLVSNWCSAAFIAKLTLDTTAAGLKYLAW